MADDVDMEKSAEKSASTSENIKSEKMFSLKRWNAVAMWSWDVECEICAICRVQVMGKSQSKLPLLILGSCLLSRHVSLFRSKCC